MTPQQIAETTEDAWYSYECETWDNVCDANYFVFMEPSEVDDMASVVARMNPNRWETLCA